MEGNIADAIDALSRNHLGKNGIVAISDARESGEDLIVVFATPPVEEAQRALPAEFWGFKVLVRESGALRP